MNKDLEIAAAAKLKEDDIADVTDVAKHKKHWWSEEVFKQKWISEQKIQQRKETRSWRQQLKQEPKTTIKCECLDE